MAPALDFGDAAMRCCAAMRERFENSPLDDPIEAVRRATRPALRRRFYAAATTAAVAEGHAVLLDDKPMRTPARRALAAPTRALAEAIAAEWQAQADVIDPTKMPLTRLVNVIIDGVGDALPAVAAEIARYLASDLVFYRASAPPGLAARQAQHWDPILTWARQALGADFIVAEGIVHVAQPETALGAARAAIPRNPWMLGAAHAVTTLTGSALIALALGRGALAAAAAWQAAHVDEDWNMAQWGRDELALQRRAFRLAEFEAAAKVLGSLHEV